MASSPSRLRCLFLGPPLVLVDDSPMVVDTRKAVALLSFLAVTKSRPSRDELATLLWPGLEPERARATLRRTLSALRTGLGGRWIEADRSRVWMSLDEVSTDLEEVQALLAIEHGHGTDRVCPECIEPLTTAAALYRSDFMAGFSLRDSPDFDEWQRNEEERHRRRLRVVLERLGLALASSGRFAEAAGVALRRVASDPLDESGHRQVMDFLVWNGDRAGAIRQYRECAALLDRDLGVSPLPETRALYERILAGNESPAPVGRLEVRAEVGPSPSGGGTVVTRFVGRVNELARLRSQENLEVVVVVVTGEEGIGKTRLVEEWLSVLQPVVHSSASLGAGDVPYLVIRDALAAAAKVGPATPPPALAAEAVRLVPELAAIGFPAPTEVGGRAGAVRFHAGVALALHHLLAGGWLVIDDAQWMDRSSVELLSYLLTHPEPQGPRLVLIWRQAEMAASHPLARLTRRMQQSGAAIRIDLGPLDSDEATNLLDSRASLVQDLVARIVDRAGGNPLFLIAYQDAAGSERADLPPDLEDLVRARLDPLSETSTQVVAAAAIIGSEADLETLRNVSGRTSEELVPALEQLFRQGLLTETVGGVVFPHDAIRRAVMGRMSSARRRILHARVASAGERLFPPATIAHHLEEAGRPEEAARAYGRAGEEAINLFAYPEARAHLQTALALGHPDRVSLNVWLGDIALRLGEYGLALAAYEAAGGQSSTGEVEHRIGEVYLRLGKWQLADASYLAAAAATSDQSLLSLIAIERAVTAHRQGDGSRARKLAEAAQAQASKSGDEAIQAQAANLAGMLASEPGQALIQLNQALGWARKTGRPDLAAATLNNLALAHRRMGALADALEAARQALALLEKVGDRHLLAAVHSNLADILHDQNEEGEARVHLKESARILAEVGLEPGTWEPEIWRLAEW